MTLLLAHHELAATLGAYALGLSGASVVILWRATTERPLGRVRRLLGRRPPAGARDGTEAAAGRAHR